MKTDTEQEELLPVPLQVSTPVEPVEGNVCESGDAREEVTERYRGTRTQLGVNCPDMNDDKLSKEIMNLRCILLFLGDYSVLYTFFSWVDHFTVCRLTFSPSSGEPFHMY